MSGKVNRIDHPRGARWPDERAAGGAQREDAPEPPDIEGIDDYQGMLDQGLRLNRAFIKINDSLVREAIVNLVVEAAKNESGEEVPPLVRMLLQDRPAKTEFLASRRGRVRPSW